MIPAVETVIYGQPVEGLDALTQAIGRALARGQATPGTDLDLPSEVAPLLHRERLIARLQDRIVPGPGLALISSSMRDEILRLLQPAMAAYKGLLAGGGLERLQAAADAEGLQWARTVHIIVAGQLLDLGVRRHLLEQAVLLQQPRSCWLWVYEGSTLGRTKYGVRLWARTGLSSGIGRLWCNATRDQVHAFSAEDMAAVEALHSPDLQPQYAGNLLRLRYFRLVQLREGRYEPAVPVLTYGLGALWGEVNGLARRLVLDAIAPVVPALRFLARRLAQTQVDCFLQACCRLLLEHSMDRLVADGTLPPFPETPAPDFGFWLWEER